MNKLTLGNIYRIRLTDGHWTNGKLLREVDTVQCRDCFGHVVNRSKHRFIFENLATGREILIKSMQKIKEARND